MRDQAEDLELYSLFANKTMNNSYNELVVALLQILVVLTLTKALGYILARFRQPLVIGEIFAGILLGPSLLGTCFPTLSGVLFPRTSLHVIEILSQIGLILFMFVVGLEIDVSIIRKHPKKILLISYLGILIPFLMGVGSSVVMFERFSNKGISFLAFSLFVGTAMSITAFPVLARIIKEKGLSGTSIAAIAVACAGINDIMAWCLLAIDISIVKTGSFLSSMFILGVAVLYLIIMFAVVRPILKGLVKEKIQSGEMTQRSMTIIFLLLLSSSLITEGLRLHALFGAFCAGLIMPSDVDMRRAIVGKVEYLAVIVFLPLFFVSSGLKTKIFLLQDSRSLLVCVGIILISIFAKMGGTTVAARFVGFSRSESFAIGSLMNTRGMMEMVVLNIGYDLGVLSPELFTMMVLMAIISTCMTSPMLDSITRAKGKGAAQNKMRQVRRI
jgi:Kef-type K+ transport system membrane component KefB